MNTYTIVRKSDCFSWDNVPVLRMDNQLWTEPVSISATTQICYDDEALYVRQQAFEDDVRAVNEGPLAEVSEDSCLEFFFAPKKGDIRYLNCEFSPNGSMYLGLGPNLPELIRIIPETPSIFPKTEITENGWVLEYSIPHSYVRKFFPEWAPASGYSMRANCFKCGDLTAHPHYLSWNYVDHPTPLFHCPQCFGTMYFE